MACGLLCGQSASVDTARAELLCELIGIEQRTPELSRSMMGVLRDCHQQMASGAHDFEPMLPGDGTPLKERTMALARWCEGFLVGVGAAGAPQDPAAAEEREEVLRDLSAIAQADAADAGDEEHEWHFFEVKEYVRMAATSFFLDAQSEPPESSTTGTVH